MRFYIKFNYKDISIVANNVKLLSREIRIHLGEHGMIIKEENLNQKDTKTIILIIVDITKLQLLKEIINEYDPEAFMVIQEASEL